MWSVKWCLVEKLKSAVVKRSNIYKKKTIKRKVMGNDKEVRLI